MEKQEEKTQQMTEQAPRKEQLEFTIERVQFGPVEELEKLAKVGFCTERAISPLLGDALYRMCCEVTRGDVDQLPVAVTPFVSASMLNDLVAGAVLLQPAVVKFIKEAQANVTEEELNKE